MATDFVKNVSLYEPEQQEIARQRKLAELLMQQGQTPSGPTENIGGWAVKRSPMEGIGKMAQTLSGAYQQKELDARTKALVERMRAERSQDWGKLMEAMQPTPAQPAVTDVMQTNQNMDTFDPRPATAAQPPTGINPALIAQLRSDEVRQLAAQQMMKQFDPYTLNQGATRFAGNVPVASGGPKTFAPPAPPRPAPVSNLSRLIAERDALPPNDPRRAAYDNAIRKNSETAKQISPTIVMPRPVQPLVQIMTPDGPKWVERKEAIGQTPAGVGSKAEATAAGKADVDKDITTLKSALDELKASGGITSTEKGVVPNIGSWAANTPVGQTFGSMGGTRNQKSRDVILQARPLLVRSIMQATGMSARSMDSNAELKLWLSTATDPTKGYEANVEALNNIASKYGSGGFLNQGTNAPAPSAPAGVDPKVWAVMTPEERALWK